MPTAQSYGIDDILFSPDGQQVLTAGSDPVESWRVSDGESLYTFPDPAYSMAFSADGSVLATVHDDISFYETEAWALMQKYPDGYINNSSGSKGIAFAPTGGVFLRSRGKGDVMAARVPVWLSARNAENGALVLRWVGGAGYYQLQCSLGLSGAWEDDGGVTTSNSTTVTPGSSFAFFRAIGLPE